MSGSETHRHRHLTAPYCTGNGVDIGSGGDPVVPHAIQVELASPYGCVFGSLEQVEWRGDALTLPFKDGTLDFAYSSHLLEDFEDWTPPLREWSRVLKPGGHLVILLPDKSRWQAALDRGQPPNLAHKHEGTVGELSGYAGPLGLVPIVDGLTSPDDVTDYTILFVAKKL
jgi:SAM-dependent methyltransferase